MAASAISGFCARHAILRPLSFSLAMVFDLPPRYWPTFDMLLAAYDAVAHSKHARIGFNRFEGRPVRTGHPCLRTKT